MIYILICCCLRFRTRVRPKSQNQSKLRSRWARRLRVGMLPGGSRLVTKEPSSARCALLSAQLIDKSSLASLDDAVWVFREERAVIRSPSRSRREFLDVARGARCLQGIHEEPRK